VGPAPAPAPAPEPAPFNLNNLFSGLGTLAELAPLVIGYLVLRELKL